MGTFFRSVAARTGDRNSVESLLITWLSAKGFEPMAEAPLFQLDGAERGLCLFSKKEWVVVLYSQMETEGQRLIHELGKLDVPLLETWVHDSDIWGYDLYQQQELVASFNSDPYYFGQASQQSLPVNGDVTTLCEVCRLGAREQELARIQDKQAAMKEWICEQFCAAIDAAPLGIGYQIIDGFGLVGPLTADIGGFQMKSLYFAERNRSADPPAPALHSLTLRKPTRPVRQDITPEMEAYVQSMQWRINVLRVLLYPMTLLFHIAVWLYVRYQHLRWRWSSDDVTLGGPLIEIYRQLSDLAEGSMHRDGHELTNERYRCRITVPENTEVGPQPIGTWVFHLKVGECDIQCRAMRPRDLKWSFGLHPSAELVEDAKFSVGEFQARTVVTRFEVMGRSSVHYTYYVQTARAVYLFEAEWTDELPPETRRLVEDIVRSFRQG